MRARRRFESMVIGRVEGVGPRRLNLESLIRRTAQPPPLRPVYDRCGELPLSNKQRGDPLPAGRRIGFQCTRINSLLFNSAHQMSCMAATASPLRAASNSLAIFISLLLGRRAKAAM